MIIELDSVIYDARARDGTWCTLPYPNHKHGCPNFPRCIEENIDLLALPDQLVWYAVLEHFDLQAHEEKMKERHPEWSKRQCRNLLYWQGGVRKRLREKAKVFMQEGDILLQIPEANGVNVFATIAQIGLCLRANPDYVTKIMLVGRD